KKELSPVKTDDIHFESGTKKQIILQPKRENIINQNNPTSTSYSIDLSSLPDNEAKPDNLAAYQYHQPKPIENLADPKKVAEVVRGFLAKFKSTPKADRSSLSDRSQLSKLNSWLQDPILYSEAVQRAEKADYHIDYNEYGIAIEICDPDF
ncbi:MAG: hypothetical protein ACFBSE_15995, partial [Prochloraceae cyanobacterium]